MKINLNGVLKIAAKFVKGAAKSVPFVGPVLDGIENATKKDVVTGEPKSHDQIVWVAEMIGLVCVVGYLVHKGVLTADVLTDLINKFVGLL